MFKYFSTQRPIVPGSYPKPEGNKVLEIVNFDERKPIDGLFRPAWGFICYAKPLPYSLADGYELSECGPFYMNKETGEVFSRQRMLQQFREDYDGGDDTNALGWEEYYEEQK